MSEESCQSTDRPIGSASTAMLPVTTTPQQLFSGLVVRRGAGPVVCTECNRELTEGQSVIAYAYRSAGADTWDLARVYCDECGPDRVTTPTLGATEVLLEASLGRRSFPVDQHHRLCLNEVVVTAWSPPSEGAHGDSAGSPGLLYTRPARSLPSEGSSL